MFKLDDRLLIDYLDESRDALSTVESDLLTLEQQGEAFDEDRLNGAFRAIHTLKGGSGFFNLVKIGDLAHQAENVLALIRSRKMVPTPSRVHTLLRAVDCLRGLIDSPESSNQAVIAEPVAELAELYRQHCGAIQSSGAEATIRKQRDGGRLRVLLVEDDFACRLLLQTFLSRYGECHIAVNGVEAVEAAREAMAADQSYDLICMDIMMPEMDGCEAVHRIRALEEARGIRSTVGARIFMTTTVEEVKEVILCFKELCDAYLMKPIDLGQLQGEMKLHQLIQ
jgi:two-component system chemotaxis response regulator CheY